MDNKRHIKKGKELSFFERYLSVWVALCIVAGVAVGQLFPSFPQTLSRFKYAQVSIPVAILIWLMIYPMMVQIDFSSIVNATKNPKGLVVTCVTNWLIKPFTMYLIAYLFLKVIFRALIPASLSTEYLAGAVLLGAAPCTAMVFVWSYLTKGDAGYTLVQVAVNDLILVVAFAPIVMFLLGVSNIQVPYDTVILSVILFVVIPLTAGFISRNYILRVKGAEWFENVFLRKLGNTTIVGLLLTLIIIFSFQGDVILKNPIHIGLIAVPLTIQTFLIFIIAYLWAKAWKLKHSVAAPAALIGASNFFELAVAVAISLFGLESGAALATVVGVLVEVPVMLGLVRIANRTTHWFPAGTNNN
ncbi:MAG: Arsenical-resistance protein ACR3 [Firmicutes bacterium]|nr:Arsenical-resistance protein ACR3 [Bacillota bacterium]MDI6705739.1 ACR3 family arsenite efflux transporter [Bacillota bacterium]